MRRTLPRHTPSSSDGSTSGTPIGTPRSERSYPQEDQSSYFAEKAPFLTQHSRASSYAQSPGPSHASSPRHSTFSSQSRHLPRWSQVTHTPRPWRRTAMTAAIPLLLIFFLGTVYYKADDIQAGIDPDGTKGKAVGEAWDGFKGSVHGWWNGEDVGTNEEELYNSANDPQDAQEAAEGEDGDDTGALAKGKSKAQDEDGNTVEEEGEAEDGEGDSDKDDQVSQTVASTVAPISTPVTPASKVQQIVSSAILSQPVQSSVTQSTPIQATTPEPTSSAAVNAIPASDSPAEEWNATAKHFVSLLPTIPDRKPEPGEKFLGYLPHSGFHNQRIELQNAFALAAALNRTLLVPPIWIGWTWPWDRYTKLQEAWDFQLKVHAASFGTSTVDTDGDAADGLGDDKNGGDCKAHTKACRTSFKDTFMSWDYLSDIPSTAKFAGIKIVERWNVSEAHAWELAGVQSEEDVLVFNDDDSKNTYKYIFQSELKQTEMIQPVFWKTKYTHSVSVPILAQQPQKLILIGTLFGSTRLKLSMPIKGQNQWTHLLHPIARSLVFDAPLLLNPTNAIANLLGGEKMSFVGAHLRVGDGIFKHNAPDSVMSVWEGIVKALGVDLEVAERLVQDKEDAQSKAKRRGRMEKVKRGHGKTSIGVERHVPVEERSTWAFADEVLEDRDLESIPVPTNLVKRAPAPTIPPPALSPKLRCHAPLHTDPALLRLNHPIYLATDAPHARVNPLLSRLLATFPCIFTWDDFTALAEGDEEVQKEIAFGADLRKELASVRELKHSVNVHDGVELGRLFTPFMEAMVAAKGAFVIGTPGSTFSGFATGEMHAAYRSALDQQLKGSS